MLCCEIQSYHACRHNDLGGYSNFSSTSLVSLFCAWNITTVRSTVTVTYLKVKSAKCLCLLPVVLVLFFRSWSWSCYFGLGLGLKNLVLLLQGLRAGGACCPLPKNPPRSRPSASIFGPSGLIRQPPFQQSSFPPMHRGLDKTLVIPIFGAKECIIMQDFVLKIYTKIRGSPRRKGRHLFAPNPCRPTRC